MESYENPRPAFSRLTDSIGYRMPRESVLYWNDLSRLILTLAAALATILYLIRGGNLIRLSPAV